MNDNTKTFWECGILYGVLVLLIGQRHKTYIKILETNDTSYVISLMSEGLLQDGKEKKVGKSRIQWDSSEVWDRRKLWRFFESW